MAAGEKLSGPLVTCGTHANSKVLPDVVATQRFQLEAMDNTLDATGAYDICASVTSSSGWPEQHHLQQFVMATLAIRQQTDFFQRLQRHRMRFVDQHYA